MCDFLCDLRGGFGATLGLGDLAAEVVRRKVGVPLGHRQRGVAEDLLKGLEAAAPHDEPRGEVVPAGVEVEVVGLRLGDRRLERGTDIAARPQRALIRLWGSFSSLTFGPAASASHSSWARRSRCRSKASGRLTAAADNRVPLPCFRRTVAASRCALYSLIRLAVIAESGVSAPKADFR